MIVTFYAKTPNNDVTDPEWNFSIYEDETYKVMLYSGVTTGPSI